MISCYNSTWYYCFLNCWMNNIANNVKCCFMNEFPIHSSKKSSLWLPYSSASEACFLWGIPGELLSEEEEMEDLQWSIETDPLSIQSVSQMYSSIRDDMVYQTPGHIVQAKGSVVSQNIYSSHLFISTISCSSTVECFSKFIININFPTALSRLNTTNSLSIFVRCIHSSSI